MSFSKLNTNNGFAIAALVGLFFVTSCNDSDKSGKSSTTKDTTASNSTTIPAIAAKKAGKASVKAMEEEKGSKIEKDKMGYYTHTDVMPVYPDGQDALQTYVDNNLQYPQEALDNNIEGTIRVQFAIDDQGKVSNAKTIGTKIGYGLEDEAIKLVNNMPKWTPGMVKGKKVKAWYTLPVAYKLEG